MKKMNNLITEREIFLKNSAEKRRSARHPASSPIWTLPIWKVFLCLQSPT